MRQSQRARDLGDDGIAVEAKERHGRGQHARALVLAFVEQFARGAGDHRDADRPFPDAAVVIIARSVVSIGRFGSDRKLATPASVLSCFGIEDVQDRADQQRMAGLLPMVASSRARLRDRPARRRCSGRRGPPIRRGGPRAADCRRRNSRWSDRTAALARGALESRRSAASSRP